MKGKDERDRTKTEEGQDKEPSLNSVRSWAVLGRPWAVLEQSRRSSWVLLGCFGAGTGGFGMALGCLGGSWVVSGALGCSLGGVFGAPGWSWGSLWEAVGWPWELLLRVFMILCQYEVLAEKELLALRFQWKSCYLSKICIFETPDMSNLLASCGPLLASIARRIRET